MSRAAKLVGAAVAAVTSGCGGARPTVVPAVAPTVETAAPAAPEGPAHARVPEPTVATGGGARCELGAPILLGETPRPRVAAVAFQVDGGLAAWLGGADASTLVVQPLGTDGTPAGASVEIALTASAVIDGLQTADGYYVVLYRTDDGSTPRLGGRDQATIRLLVLDAAGAKVADSKVGSSRWRDEPYLRYRDGALRVIVPGSSVTASDVARSGALAPPSLDLDLQPLADPSYYEGGYWLDDPDLRVMFETTGDNHQFALSRRHGRDDVGSPVLLPVTQLDFYAEENGALVIESAMAHLSPRWGWNGRRYLVSVVRRAGPGRHVNELIPLECS